MTETDYKKQVSDMTQKFKNETQTYINASKSAASYTNLMTGRVTQMVGLGRGENGKTAPEIDKEKSYERMSQLSDDLTKRLGVQPETAKELNLSMQEALKLDNKNLEKGITKLNSATAAAIAAPAVPLIMAAAPLAAAGITTAGKAVGLTVTAKLAGSMGAAAGIGALIPWELGVQKL